MRFTSVTQRVRVSSVNRAPQAAKFPSDPSKRICTFVVKSLTTHSLYTPSTPPASPHIPRSVM